MTPALIRISAPADGGELPEPERVPLFEINGKVYTMLADPPPTLGVGALQQAELRGGPAYAEMYVLKAMLGSPALRDLIAAGEKRWMSKAQYNAILAAVRNAALGAQEDDDPNP